MNPRVLASRSSHFKHQSNAHNVDSDVSSIRLQKQPLSMQDKSRRCRRRQIPTRHDRPVLYIPASFLNVFLLDDAVLVLVLADSPQVIDQLPRAHRVSKVLVVGDDNQLEIGLAPCFHQRPASGRSMADIEGEYSQSHIDDSISPSSSSRKGRTTTTATTTLTINSSSRRSSPSRSPERLREALGVRFVQVCGRFVEGQYAAVESEGL